MTRETARYLALWMAFDDVIRVADLKCRASRFARVRTEVGAADGDLVRIVDHFKPGIPEIAGTLPRAWSERLVRWDRSRQARGKAPFRRGGAAFAETLSGYVVLRVLAAGGPCASASASRRSK